MTRYIGRKSLAQYSDEGEKRVLQDHLDLQLPIKDRSSFVRDNGLIPCRYAAVAPNQERRLKQMSELGSISGKLQREVELEII